jgi:NAD+ diphosphatase
MTNPQNVLKYCPKCGSSKFVPDSDKSFVCEACHFHFFVNSAAAVAAIIVNSKNEILLTVRGVNPKKGMLDLPGGFVDPGESAEDALMREIKEELNLDVVELKYLVSFPNEYVFAGYTVYTTDLGFVCKVQDFSSITFNDDISGYVFKNPKDIISNEICSESILKIIETFIDNTLN